MLIPQDYEPWQVAVGICLVPVFFICALGLFVVALSTLGELFGAVWDFCNPTVPPLTVRKRLSVIVGVDGKPLIVCEVES